MACVAMWVQEERRQKEREQRDEELEQLHRNREIDEIEEANFQSYAIEVIEHCEKRGRNTYPLRRAAASGSRQVKTSEHSESSNLRQRVRFLFSVSNWCSI